MNHDLTPVSSLDPIRHYFQKVWKILSSPRRFFLDLPAVQGLSGPLAFALVTHWLARAMEFFWRSSIGGDVIPYWQRLFSFAVPKDGSSIENLGRLPWFHQARGLVMNWFWGAGSVAIDPFLSVIKILVHSLILFIGARILISFREEGSTPVTYESVVRVVCYGMTPALLAVVPFFGPPAALLYGLAITVVGLTICFRIGIGRALVIALFPQILVFAMIGTVLLGILLFIARMASWI